MPFIDISGIPTETPPEELEELEKALVAVLAIAMDVREEICHVFMSREFQRKQRKPHLLKVSVESGFFKEADPEFIKNVTKAVARVLYNAFFGEYSLEVFPVTLDGDNKTYIKHVEGASDGDKCGDTGGR